VSSEVDLVIFDNDGVLVDSELLANHVLADLLTELGVPTTVEQSVARYLGGTVARVRTVVRDERGVELPAEFDDTYHRRLFAAFEASLTPVPGVEAALDALAAVPLATCVASSGTHERIALAHRITGLARRFEGRVFSAEDVAHGKPSPDLFLHAAERCDVDPAACVVVEDSPLGVAAARAAGMRVLGFAAVTPASRLADADEVFTSMAALPGLVASLG